MSDDARIVALETRLAAAEARIAQLEAGSRTRGATPQVNKALGEVLKAAMIQAQQRASAGSIPDEGISQ